MKKTKQSLWQVILIVALFIIIIAMAMMLGKQSSQIQGLEEGLQETQEQLLISNDKLKMIEMRNEGEQYRG